MSYNLLRADYPNNQKRGGVYLYFKENLRLRQIDTHFPECLPCQIINIQNKKGHTVVLYRSLSQISAKLTNFKCNFDNILTMLRS